MLDNKLDQEPKTTSVIAAVNKLERRITRDESKKYKQNIQYGLHKDKVDETIQLKNRRGYPQSLCEDMLRP